MSRCAHPDRPNTHHTRRHKRARSPRLPTPELRSEILGGSCKTLQGRRNRQPAEPLPRQILSASERKVEEERGKVAGRASRGPWPPDAKRGGERGGRTHPRAATARPRLHHSPAPGCAPARPRAHSALRPSRARRLPAETSPLPLGQPRAAPPPL